MSKFVQYQAAGIDAKVGVAVSEKIVAFEIAAAGGRGRDGKSFNLGRRKLFEHLVDSISKQFPSSKVIGFRFGRKDTEPVWLDSPAMVVNNQSLRTAFKKGEEFKFDLWLDLGETITIEYLSGRLELTKTGATNRVASWPPGQAEVANSESPTNVVARDVSQAVAEQVKGDLQSPRWPDFWEIIGQIKKDDVSFIVDENQLMAIHAAWHGSAKKRFVLLSGLSGTGKTALVIKYASSYIKLLNIPEERHVAVVPVSPDWSDPTGLIGYVNSIQNPPTYQVEPALRIVLKAAEDQKNPYFLLLDEMNLARVEKYFAPFLSSMETQKPVFLHGYPNPINDVPSSVIWPSNLFIAGTLNMDETTHPISDKVLDRAFTIEFWNADIRRFLEERKNVPEDLQKLLLSVYDALLPVRRHFGYRTAGEIVDFVRALGEVSSEVHRQLIDQAIFSKILPRVRGEDTKEMKLALKLLKEIFLDLPMCTKKLQSMEETAKHSGLTRFWS